MFSRIRMDALSRVVLLARTPSAVQLTPARPLSGQRWPPSFALLDKITPGAVVHGVGVIVVHFCDFI